MDFPRAHAFTPGDTAYDPSASFPGRGARGTYVPPQGGSFAWRTDEWYLAHETLKPTKGRAGASELVHDPSRTARVVGSTLTASLVAAVDPAPPGPRESPAARVSPEDALGGHASGSLGSLGSLGSREGSERPANGAERVSALRPGASPLGRRRKGAAPRTCSARGCGAHVLDRAQGLVVMCPAHRRVTSGVAVDTGDALMRWCYHCKKAHELGAFADSVIGLSRKLATCERGRAARRAAFAKKAADGARAASEGQRTRSDGDGVDGESLGVLSRGGVRGANAQTDPTYARAGKSGSAPFRPKSEAETLAAVASARARGRSKRQQDLLDANPSRSGSHFSRSGSPPGSKSGSRDSAPYPSAAGVFSSPAADLARFASSEVPDRSSHDLARASADVTTRHDSRGFQTGHQPMRRAPTEDERTSDARQISANARDWRRRAFEDVAFEVSTRASPLELIGEKRSVFEQMAGFMGRAVTSDPPNALEQDHDADWTSRLERAANGVRHFDNGNFFMDLGEVQSMLDSDDAEPTLESDANAGSGQTRLAGDDPSGTRFSPPIASRGWYDSLAASMLPGSTRVICTARAGLLEAPGSAREWADDAPRRGALPGSILDRGAAMAGAETLARAVAPDGAIGRRTATVTAHPAVRVGAGWAADDGDCERDVVFDRESPKSFLASDSVVVVSDDSGRASLARERVTPFPSYVTVPPFAALGDAIAIRGLRGGERVHVFGQGAQPFSAVVPRGGGVDAVRITPPSLATGAAGAPSVVPGFMYVQVLAPGQPATGAAFVKVLLVDDPAVVAELDALGRGAGATCEGLVAAPVGAPALPATRGFSGTAAFERFLSDLGALIESHWRSLLYTPAGRAAMRAVCLGFGAVVKDDSACPALRAALADVAEDVDAEKTAVARDYNASYWDERFTSDVGKAAGGAVKSHLAKVLTAGKYRVVLRDAACSGEDNELEATWAALTPADVVEDAAGRLARAIDRAYAASAAELKAVLFERERGLEKLRVLKRFFLAGQGDFLANFLDLADAELRKPAQKASPTRLAHLLAVALAASARGEGAVIEGLRLEPALASRDLRAHLDAIHRHEGADDDDAVVTETPLLAVDAFVLDCRAPWPAALLLSRRSVVKYQLAFRRVFRAKRVERRLLSCWTDQQASKRWCGRGATRSALAPAFLLRQRMLHFAQSLVFYATSDVVGARWAGLEEELRRAPHVDAALAAHDAFLDAVLRDLLLANHRLLGLVADLERSCDRFCDAADRFSEAALDAATAAARRAGVAPGARAALAETTLTAALPAYVDGVRAAGASWRRLAGQFVDALRAECRVQRGSHLADLLARLQDHD